MNKLILILMILPLMSCQTIIGESSFDNASEIMTLVEYCAKSPSELIPIGSKILSLIAAFLGGAAGYQNPTSAIDSLLYRARRTQATRCQGIWNNAGYGY